MSHPKKILTPSAHEQHQQLLQRIEILAASRQAKLREIAEDSREIVTLLHEFKQKHPAWAALYLPKTTIAAETAVMEVTNILQQVKSSLSALEADPQLRSGTLLTYPRVPVPAPDRRLIPCPYGVVIHGRIIPAGAIAPAASSPAAPAAGLDLFSRPIRDLGAACLVPNCSGAACGRSHMLNGKPVSERDGRVSQIVIAAHSALQFALYIKRLVDFSPFTDQEIRTLNLDAYSTISNLAPSQIAATQRVQIEQPTIDTKLCLKKNLPAGAPAPA